MRQLRHAIRVVGFILLVALLSFAADVVTVESGKLQGTVNSDQTVRMFKGVPFAAPPVGDLRWKAPQSMKWEGVRNADKFGSACMQTNVFGDIFFRDNQPSEDCLNLTIWIPAKPASDKLPVFVWYYGGGFIAGGNSETRYDGEELAKKGIIVVEPNYRLGVFGFLAHPELSKESPHNTSGNYAFLDQVAALEWVVKNIAAFGGDAHNITIGGESAGSFSVSGLMASPLSRNLFQKALGESGAFFSNHSPSSGLNPKTLPEAEQAGVKFAEVVGATSVAQLRAKSGDELLQAAAKAGRGFGFGPVIDGYYFPSLALPIYEKGEQAHVPLLAGWNKDEGTIQVLFYPQKPSAKNFPELAKARFGDQTDQFLKLYPATTDEEALRSAEDLSGDDFIAYSTWKWLDLQRKTAPVYQYRFEQMPATDPKRMMGPFPASAAGVRHAVEINYVFETLKYEKDVPWTANDFKVSELMASYWVNFIKTGNPNGKGLPEWPSSDSGNGFQVMHLEGDKSHATKDALRGRYEFLDVQAVKADGGGK